MGVKRALFIVVGSNGSHRKKAMTSQNQIVQGDAQGVGETKGREGQRGGREKDVCREGK